MSNKEILIASILKPVDDTRMFEKLGISISKVNGFSVNIAGHVGKIPTKYKIKSYTVFKSSRSSFFKRILAGFRIFRLLLRIKPAYLIIETHELLWLSIVLFPLNIRVIYDIRENYRLTISYSPAYTGLSRILLKSWVIWWELISRPFIYRYFVAEKIYPDQLKFLESKSVLLENKTVESLLPDLTERKPDLWLFSGTIAEQCGIWECLDVYEKYSRVNIDAQLIIAGRCHFPDLLKKIRLRIDRNPQIQLLGGENFVPHQEILKLERQASVGFIHYHDLPYINGKNPTKLFEYLSAGLLIVFYGENRWKKLSEKYQDSIVIPEPEFDPEVLKKEILQKYDKCQPGGKELSWESQEDRLILEGL